MGTCGFLVAGNLSEALRLWQEASLGEILEEALALFRRLQQKEKEEFNLFLQTSEEEEVRRRVSIIEEFLESGVQPDDPGIVYLNDRLLQQWEDSRNSSHTYGFPAPHRNGVDEIISEFQKLSIRFGSECRLLDLVARIDKDISIGPPQDYFDKLIELKSRWMTPLFPWEELNDGLLYDMGLELQRPLAFHLDAGGAPPTADGERISAVPLSIPETANRSGFCRLPRQVFLDNIFGLDAEEVSRFINRSGLSEDSFRRLSWILESLRQLHISTQHQPDTEFFLVLFSDS